MFKQLLSVNRHQKIMKPEDIAGVLTELFKADSVNEVEPGSWQIQTPEFRLLVILSEDSNWLRVLLPIIPIQQAASFLEQFLEANFDDTQEVRYALQSGVIWGVFHHNRESLLAEDFRNAILRLVTLHQAGLNNVFGKLIESRIRQIITAAKLQGQSLEATMQTLERFYAEGVMGEMDSSQTGQDNTLAAWRYQLERLWSEVQP
jgi:hypothetical protein